MKIAESKTVRKCKEIKKDKVAEYLQNGDR